MKLPSVIYGKEFPVLDTLLRQASLRVGTRRNLTKSELDLEHCFLRIYNQL